jgi:hypothetical protein
VGCGRHAGHRVLSGVWKGKAAQGVIIGLGAKVKPKVEDEKMRSKTINTKFRNNRMMKRCSTKRVKKITSFPSISFALREISRLDYSYHNDLKIPTSTV